MISQALRNLGWLVLGVVLTLAFTHSGGSASSPAPAAAVRSDHCPFLVGAGIAPSLAAAAAAGCPYAGLVRAAAAGCPGAAALAAELATRGCPAQRPAPLPPGRCQSTAGGRPGAAVRA